MPDSVPTSDEITGSLPAGDALLGRVKITDGTDVLLVNADGSINVTLVGSGSTQYTEDAAAEANPVGTALNLIRDDARGGSLTTTDGDNVAARGTNAGELYVKHVDSIPVTGTFWQATQPISVASVPSHAVTNAGTFAVQDSAAEASLAILDDWDESDRAKVNLIAGQAGIAGGTGTDGATVPRVTLATNVALPAGTNNIGDVDVLSIVNGSLNGPGAPTIDSYTHLALNLAAGADQVLVASAASKQVWVYGIGFTVNAAGSVSVQDEDNTAITGIMLFAANSGLGIAPSGNFAMPIWKLATNKDLEVDIVTSELDGWLDYGIISV